MWDNTIARNHGEGMMELKLTIRQFRLLDDIVSMLCIYADSEEQHVEVSGRNGRGSGHYNKHSNDNLVHIVLPDEE